MHASLSMRDFLHTSVAPIQYLVPGLVPNEGKLMLLGPPKRGKSYLALQLALAVASGDTFAGRPCQPAPVLYIQVDTPAPLWHERLVHLDFSGVHIHPNVYLLDIDKLPGRDVRDPLVSSYLKAAVDECNPALVIVDVLAKLHNSKENDSMEMKKVFDQFDWVFKHRAVMYLHHTYKIRDDQTMQSPSQAGRGSSFMAGDMDANWLLYGGQLLCESRFSEDLAFETVRDGATGLWTFKERSEDVDLDIRLKALCQEFSTLPHTQIAKTAYERYGISRSTYYRVMQRVACVHKTPIPPPQSPQCHQTVDD